jgi:hypothetical protein
MPVLPNGKKLTGHRQNSVEDTKVQLDGIKVRTNFQVTQRSRPTFLVAYINNIFVWLVVDADLF